MIDDPSHGWEAVAASFVAQRSRIGAEIVARWSKCLPLNGVVLDIGCGTGWPISTTLASNGFAVCGIDPSPTLLDAFRRNVPAAETACEAAENSRFFDRRFDGAMAIGVLFLLPETSQRKIIERIGKALNHGGHLLFSAPRQSCRWNDSLTGRPSLSLGEARYEELLERAGCQLIGSYIDEGANHYFHAQTFPASVRE